MTRDEFKRKYSDIEESCGDGRRFALLKNGCLKATITEIDGTTVVIGDTDVKWLVVFNMPFSEIEASLKARGTDPSWWSMKVLAASNPILDEMVDEDELRKVMNGILSKEKKQPFDNARMRSYWSDALADVTKLLIIKEVSDPDKKASEIIDRCRHWDEQFVRSLDLLYFTLIKDNKDDNREESD